MTNIMSMTQSESFLELSVKSADSSSYISKRYYVPQFPLPKAFADFLNLEGVTAPDVLVITQNTVKTILKKRLGTSPGFLVTEGFESWLDMNLPTKTNYFTLSPERIPSPLNSNLIFGVSERVNAEGDIEKPLSDEELEFLASKLEMSEVKTVAIGFLHAQKNSANEKKAEVFLRERGFQVRSSYQSEHCTDEKQRWWNVILSTYIQSALREFQENLAQLPALSEKTPKVFLNSSKGLQENLTELGLECCFGEEFVLHSFGLSQFEKQGCLFYFGLEEFYQVDLHLPLSSEWQSEFGAVSVKSPPTTPLLVQPTEEIATGYWGISELSGTSLGYEPGPMCLGRGLKPTVLDLLFVTQGLSEIESLASLTKEKMKTRILENLSSMSRSAEPEFNDRETLHELVRSIFLKLAQNMHKSEINYFSGPLANAMKEFIDSISKKYSIEVVTDSQFFSSTSSLALAQTELS